MGRRRQQSLPGLGPWLVDPQSDLGLSLDPKVNQKLADKIFLWKTPAGPVRRLAAGAPNSYGVWNFAKNKDTAIEFLKYYADHWVDAFKASTGYNHPLFANIVPKPMPILSNDPTSHPHDKLAVLEDCRRVVAPCSAIPDRPGPRTDEVVNNFIIPDMMAKAATGQMTPEEAVKWAQKEVELIFKKWEVVLSVRTAGSSRRSAARRPFGAAAARRTLARCA